MSSGVIRAVSTRGGTAVTAFSLRWTVIFRVRSKVPAVPARGRIAAGGLVLVVGRDAARPTTSEPGLRRHRRGVGGLAVFHGTRGNDLDHFRGPGAYDRKYVRGVSADRGRRAEVPATKRLHRLTGVRANPVRSWGRPASTARARGGGGNGGISWGHENSPTDPGYGG